MLEERTEGWAAGLQLAALRLAETGDGRPSEFVQSFSGNHHYVLEYLTDEVLGHQPQHIQEFLMRTAVLDRFCAGLCDAVLDRSAVEERTSQQVLEWLYRANLFLIPLDDSRLWYRYHHLFADLLRARLQDAAPELVPVLHRRAARWHEAHGTVGEAVTHALAAGDVPTAVRLVMGNWIDTMHRGETGAAVR